MSTPDPTPAAGTSTVETRKRSPLWLLLLLLVAAVLAWYVYTQRTVDTAIDAPPVVTTPDGPAFPPLGDGTQRRERVPDRTPEPRTARVEPPASTPVLPIEGRNPKPPYPPEALSRQIAGTVVLRVNVDAAGMPTEVDFAKRSGDKDLDRAAFNTIKTWRFTPATKAGKPVAEAVEIPVDFKPTDA